MTANPTPFVDSPAVVQSPFSLIIALGLSWPVMIALVASGQDISPGILLMVIFLLGGATLVTALSEGRAGGRRLFAEQSGGGWALRGSWPLPTLLVGTLQGPAGGWLTLVGSYLFQTFSMLTPEPLGADPEIWTVELLWEQVMQTDATSSVAGQTRAGSVVALWRYPVKSMMGEELNSSEVIERGLLGDRQFAVVDRATGKVGGAKNPKKWGTFFDFRASYAEAPKPGGRISPVRITLPDGEVVSNDRADLEQILFGAFGREIAFVEARAEGMTSGVAEEYWPDMAGLEHRDTVTDFEMPAGTFFDIAVVHLLTTSTIDRLRELYPQSRFEARRFRSNIVVSTGSEDPGFVENDWIGCTVVIGDTVRLAITEPCPRCVMITLPQGDLPKDSGILRTAAQHNAVNVGVYASVVNGGTIRRGDVVVLA